MFNKFIKSPITKNEDVLNIKVDLQLKLDHETFLNESQLSETHRNLISAIKNTTKELNINNITRTKAYLDFYVRCPEVHWAFLAHLVSRNGGWNMTDLKGEFLSKLLSEQEQEDYFIFLERGNWLIFQDVFPQLLLYEKSKQLRESLFYLLPYFPISAFMETCWNAFWRTEDRSMLTSALIINEQSYLELHLLQNEKQNKVLKTIGFGLQELLNMNYILFPIPYNNETKLVGQTINRFISTQERITLGQRLYTLLFKNKNILERTFKWANDIPHTASRKDYWPHLFNDVKETIPGRLYNPQVKNCSLHPGANHLYSPQLQFAWNNLSHLDPSRLDWFQDLTFINHLNVQTTKVDGDIQNAYCKTLEKLAFTTFTKKAIFLRKT